MMFKQTLSYFFHFIRYDIPRWPEWFHFYSFFSLENFDSFDHYAACCVSLSNTHTINASQQSLSAIHGTEPRHAAILLGLFLYRLGADPGFKKRRGDGSGSA